MMYKVAFTMLCLRLFEYRNHPALDRIISFDRIVAWYHSVPAALFELGGCSIGVVGVGMERARALSACAFMNSR